MHGLINVESPNNISKWQMGFNSAFKGLNGGEWSSEKSQPPFPSSHQVGGSVASRPDLYILESRNIVLIHVLAVIQMPDHYMQELCYCRWVMF
jgi:hypothetical protein